MHAKQVISLMSLEEGARICHGPSLELGVYGSIAHCTCVDTDECRGMGYINWSVQLVGQQLPLLYPALVCWSYCRDFTSTQLQTPVNQRADQT